MECFDCDKTADNALWVGKARLIDGETVDVKGIVWFDDYTNFLNIEPLIAGFSAKVEVLEGVTYCPSCNSTKYYRKWE